MDNEIFNKKIDDTNDAFKNLNYSFLNISEIKLFHLKNALEYLKLPANTYNKFSKTLTY